MALRVIIVDDERYAISELKFLLEQYSDFEICGEASNKEECMRLVTQHMPDIVFLDIELEDKNGIDIAQDIKKINKDIYIVFATAYSRYAVDAFSVEAFDYILKPFDDQRIIETVERLKRDIKPRQPLNVLTVWKDDRMIVIEPKEVIYCCVYDGKTIIKSTKGEFPVSLTLSGIGDRLIGDKINGSRFMQTHKSFLVNVKYIKEIIPWFNTTYLLVMEYYEKDEVPVSRTYMKKFRELMQI